MKALPYVQRAVEIVGTDGKLFVSTPKGHWPSNGRVIVIAATEEEATAALQEQLALEGSPMQEVTLEQIAGEDWKSLEAVIINALPYGLNLKLKGE